MTSSTLFLSNIMNVPVFFSIGEAVAAVAIILAVYQIKKDDWETPLEIRDHVVPVTVILIGLGIAAEIAASIMSTTEPRTILELSLTWQILASLLIIGSFIYLVMNSKKKGLFNERTYNRFFESLKKRVAYRSPKQMDAVADILIMNLDDLLKQVSPAPLSGHSTAIAKSAHDTLRKIVADSSFTRYVVEFRADFLTSFIKGIKEYHGYIDTLTITFNAIIRAAFYNKNSYLYDELRREGLGYGRPLLNDIFCDQRIFLDFKPLNEIAFGGEQMVDSDRLDLFISALDLAIKGYWDKGVYIDFEGSAFDNAFAILETTFGNIVSEIKTSDQELDVSFIRKFQLIPFFVNWIFVHRYEDALKANQVPEEELNVQQETRSYGNCPKSLTAGYAELIFRLLCSLSRSLNEESKRVTSILIAGDILVFYHRTNLKNIRTALLDYIWKDPLSGVDSNLQGYYPSILPIVLSLIAMWQDGGSQERKELYNSVVTFLNTKLKPKILAGDKMANGELMEHALLPREVTFDRGKGLFIWKSPQYGGGEQEMIIRS